MVEPSTSDTTSVERGRTTTDSKTGICSSAIRTRDSATGSPSDAPNPCSSSRRRGTGGVLYGSAHSILGSTSGARFYELAQISLERFEELRPYKVLRDGQPTGKLDLIYLQRLLPKGAARRVNASSS